MTQTAGSADEHRSEPLETSNAMMERDLAYWSTKLAERPPAIELPCDRARPAIRAPSHAQIRVRIPASVAARLARHGEATRTSTLAVYFAAYCVFLGKAASTRDFLVGLGVDLRASHDTNGETHAADVVPLAVHLEAGESFFAFAARLHAASHDARDHRHASLDAIARALEIPLDPARHPLFDASFGDDDTTGDLNVRVLFGAGGDASFLFTYDATLLSEASAARLGRAFAQVLAAVADNVEVPVGRVPLLAEDETAQLLFEFSMPAFNWPRHLLLHELFEAKVDQTPAAVALTFGSESITYAVLEQRANAVAEHLVAAGVGPDAIVALVQERSPEMIVAILGVLKAGGAYLPIEPDVPRERIEYLLKDSAAKAVLTVSSLRAVVPPVVETVCVDEVLATAKNKPRSRRPTRRCEPNHLAYVIYTSGSTGLPKGVLIEHRNVVHLVLAEKEELGVRSRDALILLSSYTFDASVEQIWLALTSGAKLVLVTKETLLDTGLLTRAIADQRVTHLDTVPALLASLSPETVPSVKRVVVGGEACSVAIARAWSRAVRFHNEYGPTETTVGSLRHLVTDVPDAERRVPIGRPIGLTRAYVLDWGGCVVPEGVRGELYLGGAGVARGYLNREELTKERFLPDPHAHAPERMYRTGDLVAWLPDGSVEFFGRADSQVKVRGFRIELGEIEVAILAHKDITAAAASVLGEDADTRRIVCHLSATRPLPATDLRAFLARTLPAYMIPDAFMQLDELPKTVSGKIDRKKLPAPVLDEGPINLPTNQVEVELRSIWSDLLRIAEDRISVTKSFFELGGHSLLVMQLVSRVQKSLGVALRTATILAGPTIRAIAAEIAGGGAERTSPVPRADSGLALPATSVQRRLYVIQQGNQRSTSYNIPLLYEIDGTLADSAIEVACASLLDRHESLRTAFFFQEGQILQKIAVRPPFSLERYEIEDGDLEKASAAFVRPFSLESPPLFRAAIFIEKGRPRFLALDMHHIISDGMSVDTLMEDLVSLLRAQPLPEVGLRYFDYATWLSSDAGRERLGSTRQYWADLLRDEPPLLELPYDFRRPLSRQQAAGEVEVHLDRDVLDAVAACARAHEATPFAFFSALYSVFLSCMSGSADVVFGFPTAGRPHPDFERVVGMFVNTLVFRSQIQSTQTFAGLLADAMGQVSASLRNEDYPFEDLVEDLRLQPAPGHNPVFDTMLSYEGMTAEEIDCGTARLRERRMSQRAARLDLVLIVREGEKGYTLRFDYSADLFKRSTVERFARDLSGLIKSVLADVDVRLADLHTLAGAERDRVLHEFNQTERALPDVRGTHELFELHARERPTAPAVTMSDITWSYAEVDARANGLAQRLRREGVGRESIVGILLKPHPDMLVTILAVLKSGGAFMPIDPDYPLARKTYMVKDSKTPVILTAGNLADDLGDTFSGTLIDITDTSVFADGSPKPAIEIKRTDLAYVIYTSGSTGQPKGVQIEHGNMLNFTCWHADYFGMGPGDRVSKYASFGFDSSISEIAPSYISGANLVIVPAELRLSIEGLDQYFADKGVTVVFLPTQFGEQFFRHGTKHKVRAAFLAGEKLRSLPTDRCEIINEYGPTECAVCATAFRVDKSYENIPIGPPIWNTQIVMVDRVGRACPVGVPGELCISGESVGRGYLNQPGLTAEKFVQHPFLPGQRMYRTGDLARWLEDGNIEYLGRIDTQVKLRGFRIELGEIEQALMSQPGVREAVVVARESSSIQGDMSLVAFCTGSSQATEAELRTELAKTLPAYMVPTRIVSLDTIPMTPNGKVDKRRLPAVQVDTAAVVAPRTPIEADLRQIYADVLGAPETSISVEASFLDLGGHSLKAAILLSAIYRAKGFQLRLAKFLQASSIAEVAREMGEERPAAPDGEHTDWWKDAKTDGPLALTASQARIFAVHQMATWSTAYNIPSYWEIGAAIDLDKLEHAIKALVSRHHALRASFTFVDGIPQEHFAPAAIASFHVERWEVDEANLRVTLDRFVQPFDLANAPLLRAAIVESGERRILALDMHHIVVDGLSVRALLHDMEAIYQERATATATPSFAEYVWWEQSDAGRARREEEKAWWLARYSDLPDQLELPYDFDRPPRISFEGDEVVVDLPVETSAPLLELAKARSITPLGIFLGAWAVVLSRLGNNPDVTIGVPASGRNLRGTDDIVGMFVNTVPLRMKLTAEEPFADLCVRIGREALEAFERQSYQLNDLATDLGLVRDASRNPLFDVLFSWEGDEIVNMAGEGLGLTEILPSTTPCKFDLELTIESTQEGQKLRLIYGTKLFKRATAERFVAYVRRVLEQVGRDPHLRLRELRILEPWEREMLLEDFNKTDVAVPADLTFYDLFAAHVRERPAAIAVEDSDGAFTYAEVDRRASALAHVLAASGVGVDDVVAMAMRRSRHLLVAMVGIWKAGGGYLPIEPDAPAERAMLMITDSGARALVADGPTFGVEANKVVRWDAVDFSAPKDFPSRATPQGISYVIYTSGSTGRPKGVVIEHRNVVNFIATSRDDLAVGHDEGVLLFSSVTFDASIAQIGLAIAAGARLVVPTKDTLLDLDAFEAFLAEKRIAHLDTVPLFLSGLTPKTALSLRRVVVGGDVCPVAVAARWTSACPFFNEYGPTETTVASLRHRVTKEDVSLPRLPIGRPVANTRIYILDWTKNLAPLGVPGEMYIGGAGVARGYLNNPTLTAERFLTSRFVKGDRLYRTGDVARWMSDGTIDFLGRQDNQIKIRGFRIELGEIEAALMRHPAVAEAAVVAFDHGDTKRLCGYVVSRTETPMAEVRTFLARTLPSYMVPDAVVSLPALPVTTSGKVDRKRLPEPSFDEVGTDDVPSTEAEEKLVDIWADVLKLDRTRIPLERSFFDLGGHSLLLMLLITRIHQAFGVRLAPADVFDRPTIRGQAALVETSETQAIEPIPRLSERDHYALSSVQRRLYAMQRASPESVSYNIPTVFAVEGRVTPERLEDVVRALFQRHASLRTSFALVDGEPVAKVSPSVPFAMRVLESDEPIDDVMAKLVEPFDLSLAPLARVWLVKRSSGEELLVVDMHHIVVDGYSTSILWRDVSDIIRGATLPALEISYTDFAAWQGTAEHAQSLLSQRAFWLTQFATLPAPIQLPYDFPRPAVRSNAGDLVVAHLTKAELDALAAFAGSQDATLFATLISCFFIFLSRIGGTDDLVVGVPTSGRVHPDIQNVVGMFVNTVPWRAQVPERGTFIEFLAAVKKVSIDLLSREEYQLEDLLNELGVRASAAGHNPLFDVMFSYQTHESNVVDAGRVKLHFREFLHRTAKMELTLVATESDDGLELAFEYPTELFERRTVERLARHFATLVRNVIRDPAQEVSKLDVLAPEDRHEVTATFNATEHALPTIPCVHRSFESWVERAPNAPAVIMEKVTWSYAEVNRRANAIAAWLIDAKIGKGDLVAILLDPCPDQLTAMLGVMKAGAAFVPVDYEYPTDRKKYMLEDSAARALLTRGTLADALEYQGAYLDVSTLVPTDADARNPAVAITSSDLAYVIYTSGTTGRPKGSLLEHGNLLNLSAWYEDYAGIKPGDRVSKYASFGFDASIIEFAPIFFSGACLVVIPPDVRLSIEALDAYLAENKVAVAFVPTQFGEQFLARATHHSLRAAVLGGEKLRSYPSEACEIINAYGPTECSVIAAAFKVDREYDNIPVGTPVWNTQILVLDRHGRLCPVGVSGELCIAGLCVGRGYLNKPELTDEKFVSHPFEPTRRMYRTGDLARWLHDGTIEYLGRRDTQVKVRGFRIELGEIERALMSLQGIREATVVAQEITEGNVSLVAFVTASTTASEEARKTELARILPAYMVPSRIVSLDVIPTTSAGKVDKRRLPAVHVSTAPVVSPRTPLESELRKVYADVLGTPEASISVEASFLELGGHSLKATMLLSVLYRSKGFELKLPLFLKASSVRELAREMENREEPPPSREEREWWDAAETAGELPLTASQARMFAVHQMSTWSTAYNVPTLWELRPGTDLDRLESAVVELVTRHHALRASFSLVDGIPRQRFLSPSEAQLVVDRLDVDDANLAVMLERFVQPFDLSRAPLLRAAIIRSGDRRILALDVHHIVVDGLSVRALLDDLEALYDGCAEPPLSPTFADYVWWEQSPAGAKRKAEEKAWWLARFAELPDQLTLPYDFERPPRISFDGDDFAISLPVETSEPLLALAKERSITPLGVFLAAWAVVLSRLGNNPDVVIGVPASGRHVRGTEDIVGMFVNTVPLRFKLEAEEPFSDLAARIGREALEAFERQSYQLNDLVADLGLVRDPSRNPLFDVLFAWEDEEIADVRGSGSRLIADELHQEKNPCKFDLELTVQNTKEGLRLVLLYATKLFQRDTAERFAEHLKRVLEQAAQNTATHVREFRILQPWERQLLLEDYNRTDVLVPTDATMVDLFAKHVRERASAIAVEDAQTELSFEEVDARASALARTLASAGVKGDDIVAIALPRSVNLLVAIVGIMKAGAGYLPIEPDAPDERAALMIADSGARFLVSEGVTFGVDASKVLAWHSVDWGSRSEFPSRAEPRGTAYVIYTSGSTGKPKGVVIEHRNVVNFIASSEEVLAVDSDDRILLFSSFTFDASVAQIGLAMAAGARLVIPTKDTLLDLDAFEAFLTQKQITHLDSVPLFLSGLTPKTPLGLRRVVVGGDICPVAVASRWASAHPFYNEYGPTEATVTALRHKVTKEDASLQRLPVGRPVANTRIYILDWTRNLAPLGVAGEMYIGGAGVARGYLNNDALTAEKFVPNPYVAGGRLYRTGDIARWVRGGTIDFLGRADNQIKIRGFRIELGEIEAALLRHPEVAEAAVIAVAQGDTKRLCAYVVTRTDVPVGQVRTFLARALPSYMVPDAVVALAALPVTTSGKVDRKRLPEPVFGDVDADDTPASEAEEKLIAIWAEILKLPGARVSIGKSFFELGGHSLLLMLLITRIHQAFGVRLNPADIFDHPTIRGQAALVALREQKAIVPIPRIAEREHYPLSSVQRRLYAIQQASPESVAYNMPAVFSVVGTAEPERVEDAVRALLARHASFRTTFHSVHGEPVSHVHASVPFAVRLIESDLPVDDLMAELTQPFDLSIAPLLRVWFVKRTNAPALLVLDVHHIIIDGSSMSIVWRESADILRGAPLPPAPVSYAEFAVWQASAEHQVELREQREFWLKKFETLPAPLELPYDHRRPSVRTNRGDLVVFRLSQAEYAAFGDLARQKDVTLFALLLSCFYVFLSRIGGTDDLVVGVPTAGRVHPDVQNVIGMFVNTVPWRAQVPHEGTFAEFLATIKKLSIETLSREEYQLEDLMDDLGVRASGPGRNPLFDVMFVFQQGEAEVIDVGRASLHALDFMHRTAKMDLVLIAADSDAGLELTFEYPTELFDRATVVRLAAHFKTLIRSVIRDASQPLAKLDVLAPEDHRRLLVEFNATEHELPAVDAVHRLFEEWVSRTPDAPAVIFGAERWSYAEVNRRANAVAAWLLGLGIRNNEIVAVLVDPCAEMLPAILGVLKAGAAFVPIDHEYPVDRKSYMLEDSGARALLTRGALAADVRFNGPRLDLGTLAPTAEHTRNPKVKTSEDDAAYVIYTSGSTGKPKGVVVEHRNLLNFNEWYVDFFHIKPLDGVSKYAGFSFDASISEIFPACLSGATLVVVPSELRLAPKELSAYFDETNVRVAFLPTQFGEQFMRMTDNRTLRMVVLAGEKLRTFRQTPWKIINGYGPTEYTVCSSSFIVDGAYENIPIGKPVWNTQVLILDKHGRLCPIGVPGEICISGKSMARGYLGRPDLTAEKFRAHPFRPGDKMYCTGDLGRWLADGNLEFLGRRDTQVKVRGFRIELGEIEQTLLDAPGVKDAVVVDATDDAGTTYLIAYVVGPRALDEPQLRAKLARGLPEYMIPAHFALLDALPLTPNGKVDRRALPAISRHAARTIVPAASEIEHKLAAIWAQILVVDAASIGVTTSFFALGGHSLKAIALAGEIYRQLGVELRVSDVLSHPTIRALGERIERSEAGRVLGAIERRVRATSHPVSSVQKRMFLLQQMDPGTVAYNVPSVFSVAPGVDRNDVARALSLLVGRHEAFRCRFFLVEAEPRLSVLEAVDLPLEEARATEATLDATIATYIKPFDLSSGPLARAVWIETERSAYLLVDMHHIVTDGGSMGIFVDELTKILRGEPLPDVHASVADCAVWENSSRTRERMDGQRAYWSEVFADGVPALNLLTDYPRPPTVSSEGGIVGEHLPEETARGVRELAQKHGLSLYSVLLAAFDVLLSRLARQDEIVVGTPVSGRWHPDMQDVFGMFVNTLVLKQRVDARQSFVDFARDVSKSAIDALDNQAFPFADLVELLNEPRQAGHTPLFDVMFVLQNADARLDGDGLFAPCNVDSHTAKFDLTLVVDESAGGLGLAMEYRTTLFRKSTIDLFLRCFIVLLADIVREPDAAVGSLSILADIDRARVETDFNRTEVSYAEEVAAHRMFEAMAARYPTNRALVSGDRAYTYAEVEASANRLAHRLVSLGVGHESIVAILSPPSCELFIAELAALKAGGAFLPLDHRYPNDRLEYALRDSATRVFISAPGLDADLDWPGPRLVLDERLFIEGPTTPPPATAKKSDLAYVIYTSGSTGRPKGVAVEHASLIHYVQRSIAVYGLTASDRSSKYAGIGFDASIMETFPALCSGAELHIVPDDIRLSPEAIARWMRDAGITWTFLPTQLGEEFISRPRDTRLRWLVMGGDRLRKFTKTSFGVMNEYGPTEFTVSATSFLVDAQYENIPIGKPNSNTKIYIVDAAGQLCPPGVPGELCLVGNGMARGYLGNPDATAKKFISHPLAAGGRMYLTGDLGRWLDDGNIEFLGRIDSQVKIRGYRIELGEIEQSILEVPGVSACVVIDREDQTGDKYLCGYFVAPESVSESLIRTTIGQKLPEYMVPPALVRLSVIPYTTSGKVDRRRLPEPELKRGERTITPPENVAQALVVDAFARSLGRADVGVDDDFFDLGGNSMKAVAVVAALAADFRITANDVFRLRTARAVARDVPLHRGDLKGKLVALAASMRETGDDEDDPMALLASEIAQYREQCRRYRTMPLGHKKTYRNILLTGATGFLGCYLLRDLLATTTAKLHVAVRAKSRQEAWDRLIARATYYFGHDAIEPFRRRIVIVLSDLSAPSLGIEPSSLEALTKTIDCVMHSAALTKHYGDYSTFVAANVDATKHLVDLARAASADFNLISTNSVGMGDIAGKKHALFTELDCDIGQVADNHYVRTKLEAEKLVISLRESGLIANIFRVGFLTGDSQTLRFQENADDSAFVQKLKSFLALGSLPLSALSHSFCPVDEVSRAIMSLFPLSALLNETHQIDRFLDDADVDRIAHANDRCRAMDDASFYEWLGSHLDQPGVAPAATAVLLHEGLLDEALTTHVVMLREKTDALLARIGFAWSPVSPAHVWSMAGV